MKKLTNGWLSAVCVISILARFTTVVATACGRSTSSLLFTLRERPTGPWLQRS